MSCRRCKGGVRLDALRGLTLRGSLAAHPESYRDQAFQCICKAPSCPATATSPLCTSLKHMYDHGHPPPPRRYAFQWWLLPPSEGGAGPGLIDEPYAIVCAITAIFLFAMLGAMCVLSVPYVRRNHHNLFELSHRYVGWSLLGMLWIHVTVKAAYWANFNALGQELPQDQKVGCSTRRMHCCAPARPLFQSLLGADHTVPAGACALRRITAGGQPSTPAPCARCRCRHNFWPIASGFCCTPLCHLLAAPCAAGQLGVRHVLGREHVGSSGALHPGLAPLVST